jgi:hypothetical protein
MGMGRGRDWLFEVLEGRYCYCWELPVGMKKGMKLDYLSFMSFFMSGGS